MKVISGRYRYYQSSYGHFLPTTFEKLIFLFFYRQNDPPRTSQNIENAQFLQWILKDDDVYFKKITAS